MANQRVLTVIAYDIESDSARGKAAAILERVGVRVQKSVFEARLDRVQTDRLALSLAPFVASTDSLRFYPVTSGSRDRLKVMGRGLVPEDGPFLLF